ncbi:response regulator [Paenibacillus sp. strain BS8-2]
MTYQVLLVDDEVHAIEGVKSDLDLGKLGISRLFTAVNIRQAKDIFEQEDIQILLCDIEMPQGSGLELLEWVREHYPTTETIFLTSHADFKYAKQALQLGSVDYLLKPVFADDLEQAIGKAQSLIELNTEVNRNKQSHQLWLKHHALIIEHFWRSLINYSTPSTQNAVREQIDRHHIPITDDMVFLPILISVQKWHKELRRRDEKILEYALKNTAEEIISGDHGNGIVFHLEKDLLLVIVAGSGETDWASNRLVQLQEAGHRYIEACNRYFYCDMSCYLGQAVKSHDMADMVASLRKRDRDNVTFVNQVLEYREDDLIDTSIPSPDWSLLSTLLKTGTKEAVIHELEEYLLDQGRNQGIGAKFLQQFNQDFMQVVHSYLYGKGIQAHQLLGDEQSGHLSEMAGRTVMDMLNWVKHAVGKAMNQALAVEETDTVVQSVIRYISRNIDKEFSREELAELVYLSPDHLTRLFKKETGSSLSDYVMQEKTRRAKEMLAQTDMPISAIASAVGYWNFSHFTKIFKKYAGMVPTEYRNLLKDKK